MNKMNPLTRLFAFFAGVALLTAAANVNAAMMMTFTDKVDPYPNAYIAFGNDKSYSFTHSIIFDQDGESDFWSGNYGFDPVTDAIISAFIVLRFMDESDDTAPESVKFTFDGKSFGTQTITSGGDIYDAFFSNKLIALLSDGFLNVTLTNAGRTNGNLNASNANVKSKADNASGNSNNRRDFLFLDSTLTVNVNRSVQAAQVASVPEPETYLLISLGLIVFGYMRRKQK